MFQHFQQFGFLEKIITLPLGTEKGTMKYLDCHHATGQKKVYTFIYTAKGAASNFFNDPVVANMFADKLVVFNHCCPRRDPAILGAFHFFAWLGSRSYPSHVRHLALNAKK